MILTADVQTLIQADHQEILESYSWSRRKTDTIIALVAPYSTGTVSTVSTALTGSGTTFTSAMADRYIRIGSNTFFLRLSAFVSTTAMTLEAALGTDASAGTTFVLFQHRYNLPSDFGRITNVTSDILMREVSRSTIDRLDPYRVSTASTPEVYCIDGLDPGTTGSQVFQMEVWPLPSAARPLRVEYLKTNVLSSSTDEPLYRSDVLVWKSAESGAFFLHAKTGDAAWLALADRYHARYTEALEGAKSDDMGKYASVTHIRDSYYDNTRGDDFYINRDGLWLR